MALKRGTFSIISWLVVASVLLLASSKELICGGTPCPECFPPGRRSAPGVGIDLTMAYATAAIHFRNGTIRDLVKIDGSPEYRAAMRAITADAPNVRSGLNSSLERVHFQDPTWRNPYPISKYWNFPWAWWYNLKIWRRQLFDSFRHQTPPEYFSDDWIRAITAMLSEVKSTALDTLDPPLDFNNVYLSWPDALYYTTQIHVGRFRLACHLAGLKSLERVGRIVSMLSLEQEGIDFFPEHLNEDDIKAAMVISYNAASLGMILYNTDEFDDLQPMRALESPAHSAEHAQHDNSGDYWNQVQDLLETAIEEEPVDYVLLLGSHAQDLSLLSALKDVLDRHENVKSSVLDRYMSPDFGLGEDNDKLLFHGARGAAATARFGMEEHMDYHCYMPAWCIPDGNDPMRHVRSEL
ncbi:hypothetical protein BJX64DRAFT_246807 [Aspergillus heterothallicus]